LSEKLDKIFCCTWPSAKITSSSNHIQKYVFKFDLFRFYTYCRNIIIVLFYSVTKNQRPFYAEFQIFSNLSSRSWFAISGDYHLNRNFFVTIFWPVEFKIFWHLSADFSFLECKPYIFQRPPFRINKFNRACQQCKKC